MKIGVHSVTVKHRLDEVTIDRRTNDIEPGLVADHFNSADFRSMGTEMRRVEPA